MFLAGLVFFGAASGWLAVLSLSAVALFAAVAYSHVRRRVLVAVGGVLSTSPLIYFASSNEAINMLLVGPWMLGPSVVGTILGGALSRQRAV